MSATMTCIIVWPGLPSDIYAKRNMSTKLNQTLWGAFEALRVAESEMMRPAEDAVTICACQCTRNAADGFLRSFLMSRDRTGYERYSLSDLLAACVQVDPVFATLDLSGFACRKTAAASCDTTYCLAVEKVNHCMENAFRVRDLVMDRMALSEKDFK